MILIIANNVDNIKQLRIKNKNNHINFTVNTL